MGSIFSTVWRNWTWTLWGGHSCNPCFKSWCKDHKTGEQKLYYKRTSSLGIIQGNPHLSEQKDIRRPGIDSFKTFKYIFTMESGKQNSYHSNGKVKPPLKIEPQVDIQLSYDQSDVIDWKNIRPCSSEDMIDRARHGDLMTFIKIPDQPEEDEFNATL